MRFIDRIWVLFSGWPRITWPNLFEIIIIAYLVYEILLWIKNSRAWVLLQGLAIIFVFTALAALFRFDTILWIIGKIATIAVTALIIIFQPELRRALEQLGSSNILSFMFVNEKTVYGFSEATIEEIVKAAGQLSQTKTGALIVIERTESLEEIEGTGISIDGKVSNQLLINIFEHNTPLHDGAILIRGNRIIAATCYLPLSDNMNISKIYGTRHRAALGVSEVTDSCTIVISEETGGISVAQRGVLSRMKNELELRPILKGLLEKPETNKGIFRWRRWLRNERKAD